MKKTNNNNNNFRIALQRFICMEPVHDLATCAELHRISAHCFVNVTVEMIFFLFYLFFFFVCMCVEGILFHSFFAESIVRWGANGRSPRKNT